MMTTTRLVIEQANLGAEKHTGFELSRAKTDAGPSLSSPALPSWTPPEKPIQQETACHMLCCLSSKLNQYSISRQPAAQVFLAQLH